MDIDGLKGLNRHMKVDEKMASFIGSERFRY
jgi:hypothetical protein